MGQAQALEVEKAKRRMVQVFNLMQRCQTVSCSSSASASGSCEHVINPLQHRQRVGGREVGRARQTERQTQL